MIQAPTITEATDGDIPAPDITANRTTQVVAAIAITTSIPTGGRIMRRARNVTRRMRPRNAQNGTQLTKPTRLARRVTMPIAITTKIDHQAGGVDGALPTAFGSADGAGVVTNANPPVRPLMTIAANHSNPSAIASSLPIPAIPNSTR